MTGREGFRPRVSVTASIEFSLTVNFKENIRYLDVLYSGSEGLTHKISYTVSFVVIFTAISKNNIHVILIYNPK